MEKKPTLPFELIIEGEDAILAADQLLAEPDIEGSQQPIDASGQKSPTLAAVATIVTIVGGTIGGLSALADLSEKIYQWYTRLNPRRGGKITKIVLENSNGQRLLLESASPEEIQRLLAP